MNHEAHQAHEGLTKGLELTARTLVDAGLKVHRALGPGLLESAYEHCLAHELSGRGVQIQRQVILPIIYGGATIDAGYRLDMIVENSIVWK